MLLFISINNWFFFNWIFLRSSRLMGYTFLNEFICKFPNLVCRTTVFHWLWMKWLQVSFSQEKNRITIFPQRRIGHCGREAFVIFHTKCHKKRTFLLWALVLLSQNCKFQFFCFFLLRYHYLRSFVLCGVVQDGWLLGPSLD
jgi:hypothetical protein